MAVGPGAGGELPRAGAGQLGHLPAGDDAPAASIHRGRSGASGPVHVERLRGRFPCCATRPSPGPSTPNTSRPSTGPSPQPFRWSWWGGRGNTAVGGGVPVTLPVPPHRCRRRPAAGAGPPGTLALARHRSMRRVILFSMVLPISVLVYWVVNGASAGEPLGFEWSAAWNSPPSNVSAIAAAVTVAAALAVAVLAVRHPGPIASVCERITYVGFALPGIAVALALVFFAIRYAIPLYQTLGLLVFAYVVLFLSPAIGSVRGSLLQVNPRVEEAARSLGRRPIQVIAEVTLPLVRPGLVSGSGPGIPVDHERAAGHVDTGADRVQYPGDRHMVRGLRVILRQGRRAGPGPGGAVRGAPGLPCPTGAQAGDPPRTPGGKAGPRTGRLTLSVANTRLVSKHTTDGPPGEVAVGHPPIRCDGLSKFYGEIGALRNVTLTLEEGEVLALVGPSGSGKSTLLRLVAGFESPDTGTVALRGRVISGAGQWAPPEERRLGMVFQDYALFPHMTVLQNVAFGLKDRPKRDRADRATAMLSLVRLSQMGARYPDELSGGEQQRVALARSLAAEPRALLLDEPFSNLDPHLRAGLRVEVRRILRTSGVSAIYVTHDQGGGAVHGDRVAVLNSGALEQVGSPEEMFPPPTFQVRGTVPGHRRLPQGPDGGRLPRNGDRPAGRAREPARGRGGGCWCAARRRGDGPRRQRRGCGGGAGVPRDPLPVHGGRYPRAPRSGAFSTTPPTMTTKRWSTSGWSPTSR